MKLIRKSPANRTKQLASNDDTTVFFKWNSTLEQYLFTVEVKDSLTGMCYRFETNQLQWGEVIDKLHEAFGKAPAS